MREEESGEEGGNAHRSGDEAGGEGGAWMRFRAQDGAGREEERGRYRSMTSMFTSWSCFDWWGWREMAEFGGLLL
jgi:hypothetical protein